ncbi:MAG: hypothetical protein FJX57_25505, partial [Alphaproteobacteria bacterium]|nr:hypothetical protein [Alphaproteobacteria bacterium]
MRAIGGRWPLAGVFVETKSLKPPFPTAHPFETEREDYEAKEWFDGKRVSVSDVAKTEAFPSMNDGPAVDALRRTRPEAVIVYGTGKLGSQVIEVCPAGILNLHGGDPEHYRGLDTHLWAIARGDFGALSVTLHRVAPGLDTGDIVDQEAIP